MYLMGQFILSIPVNCTKGMWYKYIHIVLLPMNSNMSGILDNLANERYMQIDAMTP